MIANPYESAVVRDSAIYPGVCYRLDKMSFGRRLELMKAVREATAKIDFLDANGDAGRMAAAILSVEVDRLYVRWGLKGVDGLLIDGTQATTESLLAAGPEELVQEALALIKSECGLDESEKKT
jgi:hypothetical protein